MKLLFLCAVLFLIYSFAYGGRKYSLDDLQKELTRTCTCEYPVSFTDNAGKRETYQTEENRVNEKQVNVDDLKRGKALADNNSKEERDVIFGNRRKEDGLSFLRKRANWKFAICCHFFCTIELESHIVIEECLQEGCNKEEITEACHIKGNQHYSYYY